MHRIAWLIGALIVSGCASSDLTDPYKRPGTYNPTGVNDANLRGTGQSTSTGAVAAPPVARLLAGKRYPLPDLNAASVNIVSEPTQQGSANPGSSQ
jgi:hypothetical protein